jgi:hypothetical protein
MFTIPAQVSAFVVQYPPAVTDMPAKPCRVQFVPSPTDPNTLVETCSTSVADNTAAAEQTFDAVSDLITKYSLAANTVTFGETWSNSTNGCNGKNLDGTNNGDANLTPTTPEGYKQSCLFGAPGLLCPSGSQPNPLPQSVVFRPWGNVADPQSVCETPLIIGAPNGPYFKQ